MSRRGLGGDGWARRYVRRAMTVGEQCVRRAKGRFIRIIGMMGWLRGVTEKSFIDGRGGGMVLMRPAGG